MKSTKLSLLFLQLFIVLFLISCKKEKFTPVQVIYMVKVADSSTVNITYNSDYYYDSGNLKTISYLSNGGTWYGTHIAYEPQEYYIKVEYIHSVTDENNYQVKVFYNDIATAVDSVVSDTIVPTAELRGSVVN